MKEEMLLNEPMTTDLILRAQKAIDNALSISPLFAKWILRPFFGFQIEEASLFYYKHASFNFGAQNSKLFVNQNNAFSVRNTNLKANPNGWICMIIRGEICITLDDRQLLISASDGYKVFYQSNYGLHETYHSDATIIFLPVGAVDIDIFTANQNISRIEVSAFDFIDLIKIAMLRGGSDFILNRIILGLPVGSEKYRKIPYLIDEVVNSKFNLKAGLSNYPFSPATVSMLSVSGYRFQKYINILKFIIYKELKDDLDKDQLAHTLGYSTYTKLFDFLEREKTLSYIINKKD